MVPKAGSERGSSVIRSAAFAFVTAGRLFLSNLGFFFTNNHVVVYPEEVQEPLANAIAPTSTDAPSDAIVAGEHDGQVLNLNLSPAEYAEVQAADRSRLVHIDLPLDVWHVIFSYLDPVERTGIRPVSRQFLDFIETAKKPRYLGGLGWTDNLPVVASIDLSSASSEVTNTNCGIAFVRNLNQGTISVIDLKRKEPFLRTLVLDRDDNKVYLIDLENEEIIPSIQDNYPLSPQVNGGLEYKVDAGILSAINENGEVVSNLKVSSGASSPVLSNGKAYMSIHGGRVHVATTIVVVDLRRMEEVKTINLGLIPSRLVILGKNLGLVNASTGGDNAFMEQSSTISLIDLSRDRIVCSTSIDQTPKALIIDQSLLYVVTDGNVLVIDIGGWI